MSYHNTFMSLLSLAGASILKDEMEKKGKF